MNAMQKAVSESLSIVCATCRKYWKGREKNLPGSQCIAQDGCVSPVGGGTFHEYDGPITEDRFSDWCFVCGADSEYGVQVKGRQRLLGICSVHLDFLVSLRPISDLTKTPSKQVMLKDRGALVSVHTLLPKPKMTLSRLIHEVEQEEQEEQ